MNQFDFARMVAPLRRRVQAMVARGVIALINDAPQAQELQLTLLADETADGVEHFQHYGFTSVAHPGAEAAVVFVGGARSHGIVVGVADRQYRLRAMSAGEVALYDDLGNVVKLGRDGLAITGIAKVTVTAPIVEVDSDDVRLGGAGGAAVARVGDTVSGGVITGGSAKVTAA